MQRILYLDVVKALAITLVCVGHTTSLISFGEPSQLRLWIYSFHMPLFMLLCGYFSSHSLSLPFKEMILKKSKQLLIPSVSFPLLTIVICLIMGVEDIVGIARGEAIGGMWFLRTLFACYVYVWLFLKIFQKIIGNGGQENLSSYLACVSSIIVAIVVPRGYFLQFNWMLLFFWAGFFLKRYQGVFDNHVKSIAIVSTIIFVLCGRHQDPLMITANRLSQQPMTFFWQFTTAIAAAFMAVGGVKFLCGIWSGKLAQGIGQIGMRTLGIYALQGIVINRIAFQYIHLDLTTYPRWISDFVLPLLLGIAATVICYVLVQCLRRYKWTNIIFFGGSK